MEAPRALNTYFQVFFDVFFCFLYFFSRLRKVFSLFIKPQSALSLCSRFKIDRPLVGDDDQQKCKISKRRSMTENCVIMQRVSEPISLSLSSRGRKAVATTCFFSTFRVFCRYKIFVGVVFARSSLSFFSLSLSLSLSLSRMDEEETTRGDDDKKTGLYPYEVLVESFDYTIVACTFEPMMSVYFRPKRERERREESFYFCI